MSDADLRANLCTLDWRGKAFKEAALDELLRRQRRELDSKVDDIWGVVEDVACGVGLTCPTCLGRVPCACEHKGPA